MANILDIITRAQALRQEAALNSITPDRAGGIMYDTLILINQMQLEGSSLLISKVYSSVTAMEADTTPTSDLTGRALRPGQLVVIVTSDASSSDMGSEYRYNGPGSWTYVGKVGGLPMDTVPTEGSTRGITSGAVYKLQKEVNLIDGKVIIVDSQNPGGYKSIYPDNQIRVTTTGISLADAYKYANTGFRNYRIPCDGAVSVKYNIFYSSTGFGSCFVDSEDKILAGYEWPSGTATPQTVPVPSGAKFFIWSIRPQAGKECNILYPYGNEQGVPGTVTFRPGSFSLRHNWMEIIPATNRLFSARYIDIDDIIRVTVNSGYSVKTIYFDGSLSYIGESDFATDIFVKEVAKTFSNCKYVLLYIKKGNDADFSSGDIGGCIVYFAKEKLKNLEDIFCCGLSLKELFLDSNMVVNGDFIGYNGWNIDFTPQNRMPDSDSLSISFSFVSYDGNSRRYQSLNLKEGHRYLVACEAKITGVNSTIESYTNNVLNYNGGTLQNNRAMGIVFASIPFGVSTISKNGDYALVVGILEMPVENSYGNIVSKNYNIGNGGVNNMIWGKTRNGVCVDITDAAFTSQPTRRDLCNAFRKYVEYLKCKRVDETNLAVAIDTDPEFCDSDAKRAYMAEMNKIAGEIGCTQTELYNPSGVYYEDHKTTCRDYIKVGAMAMTENSFLRIINRHSMDVPVVHADGTSGFIVPTEVAEYSGASGEASAVLNTDYDIVSAKTGTWNGGTDASKTQALVMVVRSKVTGKFIVGYIHNGGANYSTTWDDNKYTYMKNLFDKVEDDSVVLSLGTTSEWSAGYIPTSTQWAKYVDFGTVKSSDTVQFPPASTTKYLTCMIALQHLKETEVVEYDILDFSTGSGAAITAGDKFTVRDAIYLCMASSSNSLANMLARYTGKRLMEESNR